ncbi:MAG: hypothetical protein WC291_10530, partial [Thermodesulfovibrionales bacterium]
MDNKKGMKGKRSQKILIAVIVLVAVAAFKLFNLGQFLTLDYIKASKEQFALLYAEHRLAVILAYAGIYIVVTSLSLPGAAVMTLAGGALFGLLSGTLVVSFSST